MKKTLLILVLLALAVCGGRGQEKAGDSSFTDAAVVQENEDRRKSAYYELVEPDSAIYHLKGGYKLYEHFWCDNDDLDASRLMYRLVGNGVDTTVFDYVGQSAYHSKFEGVDFDDYFVINWSEYGLLYDKRTGKQVAESMETGHNIDYNLAIRRRENGGDLMLLNLKTWKEVAFEEFIPKGMNTFGAVSHYDITKVTDEWIYIFNGTGKHPFTIKIPVAMVTADVQTQEMPTTVVALNDSISVQMREIPREEYDIRRATGHHPKPYKVITNKDQPAWLYEHPEAPFSTPFVEKSVSGKILQKMLDGRVKFIETPYKMEYEGKEYPIQEYEITFNDGTKLHTDESVFVAYFPDLRIVLFDSNGADHIVDFNDGASDMKFGLNPLQGAVSPDGRWRINGTSPDDVATEGFGYFLEKRNAATENYESVGDLFGGERDNCVEWSWVDNDTVLYRHKPWRLEGEEEFTEMTIIENTSAQ